MLTSKSVREPGQSEVQSHFDLLGAFVAPELLARAWAATREVGYRSHEFGDVARLLAQGAPTDQLALMV